MLLMSGSVSWKARCQCAHGVMRGEKGQDRGFPLEAQHPSSKNPPIHPLHSPRATRASGPPPLPSHGGAPSGLHPRGACRCRRTRGRARSRRPRCCRRRRMHQPWPAGGCVLTAAVLVLLLHLAYHNPGTGGGCCLVLLRLKRKSVRGGPAHLPKSGEPLASPRVCSVHD